MTENNNPNVQNKVKSHHGDGSSFPSAGRVLILIAAFIVVVAGINVAEPIIVPFLLSLFIAIISAPLLFLLQKKGLPDVLALTLVGLAILGAGLIVAALVGTSLTAFTQKMPEYQQRIEQSMSALLTWLDTHGVEVSDKRIIESINPGSVMNLISNMASQIGSMLTNGFLIFLTVMFMLLEASAFPKKLSAILGRPEDSLTEFTSVSSNIKRYLAIKTVTSMCTGLIVGISLAVLRIDFALLWGLLAFLLNFVPNIGSIIAAVPAVILAFIQYGTGHTIGVAAIYLAVNIVIGSIIEPKFMGKGLGLSTLVVFLSLVFWGWVLGPVGMLLSVPLTMTVKIALQSHKETRPIAILLASDKHVTDLANGQIS